MSNSEILCGIFNLYVLIVGALLASLCLFISLLVDIIGRKKETLPRRRAVVLTVLIVVCLVSAAYTSGFPWHMINTIPKKYLEQLSTVDSTPYEKDSLVRTLRQTEFSVDVLQDDDNAEYKMAAKKLKSGNFDASDFGCRYYEFDKTIVIVYPTEINSNITVIPAERMRDNDITVLKDGKIIWFRYHGKPSNATMEQIIDLIVN